MPAPRRREELGGRAALCDGAVAEDEDEVAREQR